jgi:hypothetical protein
MRSTLPPLKLKEDFGIDTKLEKIWSDYYMDDPNPISALYQEEVLLNSVTYLSLNPSLHPKDFKDAKRGYSPTEPYPLIDWTLTKAEYRFYQKFYNLGIEVGPWTFLDLLYIRESIQEKLNSKFKREEIKDSDKRFLISQMRLTFDILEIIQPKVVVVSNALTVRLIHNFLNELSLSQELPTEENNWIYRINGIPFITNESRYLGSRYLVHNKDRQQNLINEIERVIKITNS